MGIVNHDAVHLELAWLGNTAADSEDRESVKELGERPNEDRSAALITSLLGLDGAFDTQTIGLLTDLGNEELIGDEVGGGRDPLVQQAPSDQQPH